MNKITRREFLKLAAVVGSTVVFSQYRAEIVSAVSKAIERAQVIILDGQACEGCAISLLQGINPSLYDAVELAVDLEFLIPITPETGRAAAKKIDEFIESDERPKVLVVEGSVPMADNGMYQVYWDYRYKKRRPFKDLLKEAAEAADAIIAAGTAAAYGGIPRGYTPKYGKKVGSPKYGLMEKENPTGAVGVGDALEMLGVDMRRKLVKEVINLPTCPVHPDHFYLTVVDLIFGNVPELDELGRPKAFYGRIIHDECPFRGFYDKGQFLTSFAQYSGNPGDPFPEGPEDKGAGCFLLLGCRGPVTHSDCPVRKWNCAAEGVSFPIQSGGLCTGCANPEFPDGETRNFYVPLTEDVSKLPKPVFIEPPKALKENAKKISLGVMGASLASGMIYAYRANKKKKREESD